jgi:hypothetical protein
MDMDKRKPEFLIESVKSFMMQFEGVLQARLKDQGRNCLIRNAQITENRKALTVRCYQAWFYVIA